MTAPAPIDDEAILDRVVDDIREAIEAGDWEAAASFAVKVITYVFEPLKAHPDPGPALATLLGRLRKGLADDDEIEVLSVAGALLTICTDRIDMPGVAVRRQ